MPFRYGQILEANDICDRHREVALLDKIISQQGRAIVYGRRRFGKTSVLHNILYRTFLTQRAKSTALYVDLYQVSSMADAEDRFKNAFEQSLKFKINLRQIWNELTHMMRNFKLELSMDPLLAHPNVTLSFLPGATHDLLGHLFTNLHKISQKHRTLIILDEVQDILAVPTLEAKLRTYLQQLNKTAVIITGSKHHILGEMIHNERRPFYGFGMEVEFGPIPAEEWLPYMRERFKETRNTLGMTEARAITTLMEDVPNAIQELCQWMAFAIPGHKITIPDIHRSIEEILEHKGSRYLERLVAMTEKEKKLMIVIAKRGSVKAVNANDFIHETGGSPSGVKASIKRYYNYGILDRTSNGYQLVDPLFKLYLARKC